jgi:diguanylate cyclase (GGDEF)-like protein
MGLSGKPGQDLITEQELQRLGMACGWIAARARREAGKGAGAAGRQCPGCRHRGAVLGSVRHIGSSLKLRELPRWGQVLVAGTITAYCAAIGAAADVTRVQPGQLRLFAVLLACSVAGVELTRRLGEPDGIVRDAHALWDLPAAVLLPPLYALLMPIPGMVLTQVRLRRVPPHRRAYTTAAVGLACAAASVAFHAAAPALGPGAGDGTGVQAMAWTALAVGCGLLRLAVRNGLMRVAAKWTAPVACGLREAAGREALYGNAAELSLATLSAFAAAHSPLAAVYAVPLVISLQRSVRHAQLIAETRTDGKTGLLNDRTWRREAAGEVARAARTRSPLAVGILDIDHFKKVNDTYGHLAGDAVLAAVAAATRALLREYDIIGRVGGEEFAFVLPGTPLAEAAEVAERLRERIPRMPFPGHDPATVMPSRVTVSIGLATGGQDDWDLGTYYSLADQALYAAKQHGRNAVWAVIGEPAGDPEPRPLTRPDSGAPPVNPPGHENPQ